jgi:hypothetical protein
MSNPFPPGTPMWTLWKLKQTQAAPKPNFPGIEIAVKETPGIHDGGLKNPARDTARTRAMGAIKRRRILSD